MRSTLFDHTSEKETWSGAWLSERLPATLTGPPRVRAMIGLALRRSTRRVHLLVSRVLGKHVPVDPRRVLAAGHQLGDMVRERLRECGATGKVLVIGYAETATALGQCVA